MGWSTAWIADDIVAALIAGGLSAQEAARGYAVIWHHIVGELTVTHSLSAQRAAARSDQPVGNPGHELPTLAALEDAWPAIRAEDHFERGLSALVSGLLARP